MITSSRLLLGLIALATSLTVGCAADESDDTDGAEASEDAVIAGSETFERGDQMSFAPREAMSAMSAARRPMP